MDNVPTSWHNVCQLVFAIVELPPVLDTDIDILPPALKKYLAASAEANVIEPVCFNVLREPVPHGVEYDTVDNAGLLEDNAAGASPAELYAAADAPASIEYAVIGVPVIIGPEGTTLDSWW
jgi:hypothetical protein